MVKCHGVQLLMRHVDTGHQVVIPAGHGLRQLLMEEVQASPVGGHLGVRKVLASFQAHVFWPQIHKIVSSFVAGCQTCQHAYNSTCLPTGQLQPLPIPASRFTSWSMDFITSLPCTALGYNTIFTCVDYLSKFVRLIPCMVGQSALGAGEVAEMFFTHIVWQFGLPGEVVHDWDVRFTADLWQNLWAFLGTRVHLSSMHHPQSDG